MASRIGKKKALIALARTMLVSIYHMIKKKEPYEELGSSYFDNIDRKKTVKNLRKRIEALGFDVELKKKTEPPSDQAIEDVDMNATA